MRKLILLIAAAALAAAGCGSKAEDTAPPKLTANQKAEMTASLQAEEARYHIKLGPH